MRQLLARREVSPTAFRAALEAIPAAERDAWVDVVLGLSGVAPDDATALPRGCVPYLPAPIDKVLLSLETAGVTASDVFVDIGAGVGRAMVLASLLTGARAIGVEIQPALAAAARELSLRTCGDRVTVVESDATTAMSKLATGTVFFLYCPFSGDRLAQLVLQLDMLAQEFPIRVICLDLPLPPSKALTCSAQPSADIDIYTSCAPRNEI